MWLIKVHTSQEAPTSTSGSGSLGNPYIGMSAEQLAEELGYIISDKSEIDLAEDNAKAIEINYKEVSKILL